MECRTGKARRFNGARGAPYSAEEDTKHVHLGVVDDFHVLKTSIRQRQSPREHGSQVV